MNIKGYLINILGRDVAVTNKPSNPVVKFITKDEADKLMQSIENKWIVTETLTTLDGNKIIVNYIKKAR